MSETNDLPARLETARQALLEGRGSAQVVADLEEALEREERIARLEAEARAARQRQAEAEREAGRRERAAAKMAHISDQHDLVVGELHSLIRRMKELHDEHKVLDRAYQETARVAGATDARPLDWPWGLETVVATLTTRIAPTPSPDEVRARERAAQAKQERRREWKRARDEELRQKRERERGVAKNRERAGKAAGLARRVAEQTAASG